ncbi:GtrA family protein [Weissella cibaria]|uniref:GtrA family protein n=1 Tax=Weissella cibaria TaxID=137591 RepID=UPI0007A5DE61|nr:GtrA family protein [Weissella cibaria]QMU87934.1 GtrA family protein [Weissella cibaria]
MTFIKKHRSIISYIFWGGITTLISLGSYALFISLFHVDYQISNILSWILSVTFAFFTNKYFVFKSKSKENFFKELINFYLARLSTLILEAFILWLGISVLNGNEYVWKFLDQIIILIVNFIASKLIFKSENANR